MFVVSALLLSTGLSYDVSTKFYNYAKGFCGGNPKTADIGNGNLMHKVRRLERTSTPEDLELEALGRKHAQLNLDDLSEIGLIAGRGPTYNKTMLGSTKDPCATNEATGKGGSTTTCVWDKVRGTYHWCKYSQYKCMSRYSGQSGEATYYGMTKKPATPQITHVFHSNELKDENVTVHFKHTFKTSIVQKLDVTTSYDYGVKNTLSIGEPGLFGDSTSFSFSFDMHKDYMQMKNSTSSDSWSSYLPVPADSTTMLKLTWNIYDYAGYWKAPMKIADYAKLWCSGTVNGHHEYFVPAKSFLGKGPYYGRGTFTGGEGLEIDGEVAPCPVWVKNVKDVAHCGSSTKMPQKKD